MSVPFKGELYKPISDREPRRYHEFTRFAQNTMQSVYKAAKKYLPSNSLLPPFPSIVICNDEQYNHLIQTSIKKTQLASVNPVSEMEGGISRAGYIDKYNIILIPENLIDISQDPTKREQMKAKLILSEECLHALTTTAHDESQSLRTGFYTSKEVRTDSGLIPGKVYISTSLQQLEVLDVPEAAGDDKVEMTELVTKLAINLLLADICQDPTYPYLLLVVNQNEKERHIILKKDEELVRKALLSLYLGNENLLNITRETVEMRKEISIIPQKKMLNLLSLIQHATAVRSETENILVPGRKNFFHYYEI